MIDPTGSTLGNSLDIQQDLRNQLKAILPQAFSDNNLDFEKLKQLLGDDFTSPREERYGISWAGKTDAFRELQQTTTNTLTPAPLPPEGEFLSPTEIPPSGGQGAGLFIEGENLEVLKVLQKSYYGKVKMIYIDPPYNTGNDSFVYPDDFSETKAAYQEKGNINLNRLNLWQKNSKDSGKYHSSWLSMMYPRLFMARNLLREDGVIFISIDDNEQANLKLLMDEVFGEENFIEKYIWESTFRPDNSSKIFRKNAESILCYTKQVAQLSKLIGNKSGSEGIPSLTKNTMKEGTLLFPKDTVITFLKNGNYQKGVKDSGYELLDDIEVIDGIIINSFRLKGKMIWGQDYLENELKKGTEIIIKSEGFIPYSKKNEISTLAPNTIIPKERVGDVLQGRAEINSLFGVPIFDYPKPSSLIKYLTSFFDEKEFIILDFFAGSGTTAQAVMELNAEDGGNRQFICVQMPEPTDPNSEAYKAGYQTIADITRARIEKVQEKLSLKNKVQYYQLQSSNFKIWQSDIDTEEELLAQLELYAQPHTTPETPEKNLLTELMLKAGFMLTANVQTISTADGIKLYDIENGTMTVALSALSEKVILTLCERKPKEFICLDNLFDSDVQKSNWSLQLAEAGVNLQVI